MILKYSRIPSLMFICVSIAIGVPLAMMLVKNASAISGFWRYVAWAFAALSVVVLIRGVQLLLAPPAVLEITSEGIRLYYVSETRGFSKEADLLSWRLIDGMQLIKLRSRNSSFNWVVELLLNAPPAFDASKRNAVQWSVFGQADTSRFYIDTFTVNRSRQDLFAALESSWQKWRRNNIKEGERRAGNVTEP